MSVNTISFLVSSACNLNCAFCFLHKHKALNQYDKEIIKSWEDKTYIPNVVNSLLKLNEDPSTVNTLNFWGGETLLHIDKIIDNIPELLKAFPNFCYLMLSTNWTTNIDNWFNFIKELDRQTDRKIIITNQISIDAPPGYMSEMGHNGWDYYLDNFKKFINSFNTTKLKNIELEILFNATIDHNVYLKEFSTYDGIKKYVIYMHDFLTQIEDLCISSSLKMQTNKYIFPGYSLPSESTVEDGLEFAKILRLWEYVKVNEFPELDFSIYNEMYNGISRFWNIRKWTDPNSECIEQIKAFTFLPDGTQVECSSSYIEGNQDYQNECLDMKDEKRYYSSLIHATHSINPLIDSSDKIDTYYWAVRTGVRNTYTPYLHFMVETCKELALAGQIPMKYYYDEDLLIKHLMALSGVVHCTRENINATLNPFLISTSVFRQYFNGAIEYIYNNYYQQLLMENKLND